MQDLKLTEILKMFLCFFFFLFFLYVVAEETPNYALLGQSIMFNANITTPPDRILWKHDGNKVVEFDGNQERLYGSYVNRAILDWLSADLEIDQLRYEDSGTYELEVFTETVLNCLIYSLEVIGKFGFFLHFTLVTYKLELVQRHLRSEK